MEELSWHTPTMAEYCMRWSGSCSVAAAASHVWGGSLCAWLGLPFIVTSERAPRGSGWQSVFGGHKGSVSRDAGTGQAPGCSHSARRRRRRRRQQCALAGGLPLGVT